MAIPENHSQTLHHLSQQLRRLERGGRPLGQGGELLSTGIPVLDGLLPEQGIPPGTLTEWLSDEAAGGAGTLAFLAAFGVLRSKRSRSCVVVDPGRSFYPPAVGGTGSRPHGFERMIVVHPSDERETLWALEQALRCSGVAAVVGWLGGLHAHAYRRLKLAAEAGGGIGLLLRPGESRAQPSWADLRLWVQPLPFVSAPYRDSEGAEIHASPPLPHGRGTVGGWKQMPQTDAACSGRLLRIELIHCRGRAGEGAVDVELDDETGDVHLVSRLASATDSRRAAGA